MEYVWFWIVLFLLLVAVLALPTWPYTRERGVYARGGMWPYGPSALVAGLLILLGVIFWLGLISAWWPWSGVTTPTGV